MTATTYDEDVHGNPLPCKVQLDDNLVDEIQYIPKWIENNWDYWILVVGQSGVGKSYLAMRIALMLNKDFNIDKIVFNVDQLREAVEKSKKGDVILFDESDEIAEHGGTAVVRAFKRYAKRISSKNLIIIMATPTLRDVNNYFIGRVRSIIYSYAKSYSERGYYHYFTTEEQLAWLYYFVKDNKVETKGLYDKALSTIMNGYNGRADVGPFVVSQEEYDTKKDVATKEVLEGNGGKKKLTPAERQNILRNIQNNPKFKSITQTDWAEAFDVDRSRIGADFGALRSARSRDNEVGGEKT